MTEKKKLPIGIDIFEKMDREEFYYVDKTGMIEDLIQNRSVLPVGCDSLL